MSRRRVARAIACHRNRGLGSHAPSSPQEQEASLSPTQREGRARAGAPCPGAAHYMETSDEWMRFSTVPIHCSMGATPYEIAVSCSAGADVVLNLVQRAEAGGSRLTSSRRLSEPLRAFRLGDPEGSGGSAAQTGLGALMAAGTGGVSGSSTLPSTTRPPCSRCWFAGSAFRPRTSTSSRSGSRPVSVTRSLSWRQFRAGICPRALRRADSGIIGMCNDGARSFWYPRL